MAWSNDDELLMMTGAPVSQQQQNITQPYPQTGQQMTGGEPGVEVGGMPDWMLGDNPVGFDWSEYIYGSPSEDVVTTPWAWQAKSPSEFMEGYYSGYGGNIDPGYAQSFPWQQSNWHYSSDLGFGPGGTPSQWGGLDLSSPSDPSGFHSFGGYAWAPTPAPYGTGGQYGQELGTSPYEYSPEQDYAPPLIFNELGWSWPQSDEQNPPTGVYGYYGAEWLQPNQNLFLEPGNWNEEMLGEWGWGEGQTNWSNMGYPEWRWILEQAGFGDADWFMP